jgi:eukaryotic-like serine/threonine-protein kinase
MRSPAVVTELGTDTTVGSYRLVKQIGHGGMATVYEARHAVLPRRAALKVMHAELRCHPGMGRRVVQEAAILERIRHPGLARIYDCDLLPDRRPWIAMELIEGQTLAERLAERGTLSGQEVARLIRDVADVLASVHACDVVHRDLKPDNLILTPDDANYPLRVIDWGVARLGVRGGITIEGMTAGTPLYMSPEQASGKNIGPRCDVYSLAVIAYEALTGHPPFDGRTLAEVACMHVSSPPPPLCDRCDAPTELCDLIHRMLDKDAVTRPDASEVSRAVTAIIDQLAAEYDAFELTSEEPCRHAALTFVDDEAPDKILVDSRELELGTTILTPTFRKPRWTPEVAYLLGRPPTARAITPRASNDQVSGEIKISKPD